MLRAIQEELLLPKPELGILQTLQSEDEPKRPADVAAELDCSYQLVGKRAVRLEERGLVKRLRDEHDHRILEITELARNSYFASPEEQELDVEETADYRGGGQLTCSRHNCLLRLTTACRPTPKKTRATDA